MRFKSFSDASIWARKFPKVPKDDRFKLKASWKVERLLLSSSFYMEKVILLSPSGKSNDQVYYVGSVWQPLPCLPLLPPAYSKAIHWIELFQNHIFLKLLKMGHVKQIETRKFELLRRLLSIPENELLRLKSLEELFKATDHIIVANVQQQVDRLPQDIPTFEFVKLLKPLVR